MTSAKKALGGVVALDVETTIAATKELALDAHDRLVAAVPRSALLFYSDGSLMEERAGAGLAVRTAAEATRAAEGDRRVEEGGGETETEGPSGCLVTSAPRATSSPMRRQRRARRWTLRFVVATGRFPRYHVAEARLAEVGAATSGEEGARAGGSRGGARGRKGKAKTKAGVAQVRSKGAQKAARRR